MKIQKSSMLVCAALFILASSSVILDRGQAFAQESTRNWARDVVNARVFVRNLQAINRSSMPSARELIRPRIVGGGVAAEYENPFQVALLLKSTANNQDAQFCGGTIVAPNKVVTAAHCSDFVNANQVQVLTDARRLDGSGTRRDVAQITIHPDWDNTTFDSDIAVWELTTSATTPSADLAIYDGPQDGELLVTGWGRLAEGGASPLDLQSVEVPLVSTANCNDSNSYNGEITANMFCAGPEAGGQDSCQGDSGGPLTRGLDHTVLTGVVSWGTGCARPNLFGVYTRVSSPGILQFIENNVPAPVLSGTGSPTDIAGYGTETNVYVTRTSDGSMQSVWGTRKYADVRATANAYCAGLGRGPAVRWEANSCGEDESAYMRFNPGTGRWESRASGSANNEPHFCRYPLLSTVNCGG